MNNSTVYSIGVSLLLFVAATLYVWLWMLPRVEQEAKNEGFAEAALETHIKFFDLGREVELSTDEYIPSYKIGIFNSVVSINGMEVSQDFDSFKVALGHIHHETLDYMILRFALDEQQAEILKAEYENIHDSVAVSYFDQLSALNHSIEVADTSVFVNIQYQAADNFSKVVANNACNMLTGLTSIIAIKHSSPVANMMIGLPCNLILNECLDPFDKELKKYAGVQDFRRSKTRFKNHIKTNIAEFLTLSQSVYVTDTSEFSRDYFFGFFTSTAEIGTEATVVAKSGYQIHKYFAINADFDSGLVVISMPEPEILSLELSPRITLFEEGWQRPIFADDVNVAFRDLRNKAAGRILSSQTADECNKSFELFMRLSIMPFISSLPITEVRFEYLSEHEIAQRVSVTDIGLEPHEL